MITSTFSWKNCNVVW